MFVFLRIFIICLLFSSDIIASEINYLNEIRSSAGLPGFSVQQQLEKAADNHASYLVKNTGSRKSFGAISAHDEVEYKPGFTGRTPRERALYAGYPHQEVRENISQGYRDSYKAIDDLMAAIYHRFTFLDPLMSEIGISVTDDVQVFVLGRADRRNACVNPPTEAFSSVPVDCSGTRITQAFYQQMCGSMPTEALFQPPWPEGCPNGTRFDANFMKGICQRPPPESRFKGNGRYYQICKGLHRVDAAWLDNLCASPPKGATYQHSGSYYEVCDPPVRVHTTWMDNACNKVPSSGRYQESGYYREICNPTRRIRTEFLSAQDQNRLESSPTWIAWPPNGVNNIPPAFIDEVPDPLPDLDYSGYPVSLQFNPGKVDEVRLESFQLFRLEENEWHEELETRLLDEHTDPNKNFSPYQFALFPINRLRWGAEYQVKVSAVINGNRQLIEWRFRVRKLDAPLLNMSKSNVPLLLQSGKEYAIGLVPTRVNPFPLERVKTSRDTRTQIKLHNIDPHTLKVKAIWGSCNEAVLTFKGGRKLRLKREGCD